MGITTIGKHGRVNIEVDQTAVGAIMEHMIDKKVVTGLSIENKHVYNPKDPENTLKKNIVHISLTADLGRKGA